MTQDLTAAVERVRASLESPVSGSVTGFWFDEAGKAHGLRAVREDDLRALLSAVTWRPISEAHTMQAKVYDLDGIARKIGAYVDTDTFILAREDVKRLVRLARDMAHTVNAQMDLGALLAPLPPPPEAK
jgi:hypothetical protein